ncbi:hypothetical protein [Flammeovirga sp. SubArs3]|uniref:hypothetical protein n=1 Tax=Flammeovirga sp. SubArs3 TaxID=2995316 RepID=UPI00248BEB12|nr:hypothetical protein [Flammeovirga sp. SubArs3]
MTISLLQYISDVKSEIRFLENEITFYLNEIKLSNERIDLYLNRELDTFQKNKLNEFKTTNIQLSEDIKAIYQEIDSFDDSLLHESNNTEVCDDTFEKYHSFKEKLDEVINRYMDVKDQLVRFSISALR